MALYQNKYRIDSLRLAQHDYSAPGEYFITICTKDRICRFGNIVSGEMHLSPIGSIVQELAEFGTRPGECKIGCVCGNAESYPWNCCDL